MRIIKGASSTQRFCARHRARIGFCLMGLAVLLAPTGCGSGHSGVNNTNIRVTAAETTATVAAGGTLTFTASATGTNATGVTWSVQEGASGGSITSAGVYTAPLIAGTYQVIATSVADPTKTATITVTVTAVTATPTPSPTPTPTPTPTPAVVGVSISPSSVTLPVSGTEAFTATVTGSTNTGVSYSVTEGATGGTVTSAGLYTASATSGVYHVVATSSADTTKTAIATVTVGTGGSAVTIQ